MTFLLGSEDGKTTCVTSTRRHLRRVCADDETGGEVSGERFGRCGREGSKVSVAGRSARRTADHRKSSSRRPGSQNAAAKNSASNSHFLAVMAVRLTPPAREARAAAES